MCREALDDWRRYSRDKEANSQMYRKLTRDGFIKVPSSDILVGDLIVVEKVRCLLSLESNECKVYKNFVEVKHELYIIYLICIIFHIVKNKYFFNKLVKIDYICFLFMK